ncbi:PepSY domain-containing protein [Olivibacter sp. SDN3]|uniref:PepSY-associated TM helix domain-containing protein n=1 Tax=Olivibacter sp. SDN3 TaxID=2764720 RepID=UPI0016517F77|nr:PepSY-associated TM helix domain-containing protein [Olivibacter sp. SDN3]QNL51676.1 PepSY domain-containing protein [Olivibacter sp. SDN3]
MMKTTNTKDAPAKKTGKNGFDKAVAWIHLWPSLVSALILIFVCLTGTIVVYCDEIMEFSAGDARYVKTVGEKKLPIETLIGKLKEAYPDKRPPGYAVAYKDPKRTIRFNMFEPAKGLSMVYMDPYTGEILKDDPTIHFFYITAHLHNSLLLGKVGQHIVDIATIIFLVELLTGLILWWPKKWTKSTKEASFKVKWKASIKRINYDLHNVVGFYALSIALILTLSGLIIAYKPLAKFTITAFGGTPGHEWEDDLPKMKDDGEPVDLYALLDRSFDANPGKGEAQIATYKWDSMGYYHFSIAKSIGLKSADAPSFHFVDKYTGDDIDVPSEGMMHEKVENVYWSLHMGTWLGQTGKFLTFVGGLVSTSLPITGFFIWWNRRKKKKRKSVRNDSPKKDLGNNRPAFRPKMVSSPES